MSDVKYNLIDVSGQGNITVVVEGEMYVANSEHPNWDEIVKAAKEKNPAVVDLFDTGKKVAEKFERLSERVLVSNGHIFFDGEEIDNALTQQVLRALDEGVEDYKPLVAFFEKVMLNPEPHSREQLFRFLSNHNITILPDGDFYLYKGVRSDGEGGWTSISTGTAIVNGETKRGAIPQPLNGIVEMPRGQVAFDPDVACHTGLHAGTFAYARSFGGGNVIKVKINPRDVVSVPNDSNDQKVRVCRYTVLTVEVVAAETTSLFDSDYDYDEDEPYCDWCDGSDHYEDDCPELDEDDSLTGEDDEAVVTKHWWQRRG